MIRLVLAVVLAAAILGVSLPAIDDARGDRTAARLDRTVDHFDDAALALLDNDPARDRAHAAGRTIRIHLPDRSWTAVRVESVRIDGMDTDRPAVVSYTLSGRPPMRHRIDAPIETPGPIVLREPGLHRLRADLLLRHGSPVVIVRRVSVDG